MAKTIQMTISGSGVASNGLDQIETLKTMINDLEDWQEVEDLKENLDLGMADCAISCLHDGLLAVAKGIITPEQIKDFFWGYDLDKARFIGTVLKFQEPEAVPVPPHPVEAAQHNGGAA